MGPVDIAVTERRYMYFKIEDRISHASTSFLFSSDSREQIRFCATLAVVESIDGRCRALIGLYFRILFYFILKVDMVEIASP